MIAQRFFVLRIIAMIMAVFANIFRKVIAKIKNSSLFLSVAAQSRLNLLDNGQSRVRILKRAVGSSYETYELRCPCGSPVHDGVPIIEYQEDAPKEKFCPSCMKKPIRIVPVHLGSPRIGNLKFIRGGKV